MMEIFSVTLGKKKFKVIGIANIAQKTAYFQAVINDVPFAQNEDYQVVRQLLMNAVTLNSPAKHEGVQ
jgi:hypothetical protein